MFNCEVRDELAQLIKALQSKLTESNEAEASLRCGEPMVEVKTKIIKIRAIRFNGDLYEVDHTLHPIGLPAFRDQEISSLSGHISINHDGEQFHYAAGAVDNTPLKIAYEIVRYKNNISISVETIGNTSNKAFIEVVDSCTYLPKDSFITPEEKLADLRDRFGTDGQKNFDHLPINGDQLPLDSVPPSDTHPPLDIKSK